MTSIRVFIGTPEGAARVQSITEEDAGVQSVICLDGRAVALPVSPEYDSFVRRPTGLIEAAYGHAAYRIDVSLPIEEGRSWQFGVLAAHALHAARRLATGDAPADHVVWTTGEVDRDLKLHPVAHLSEKLRRASALVAECKASGLPITLYVPRANFAELDPAWLREQGLADAKFVPVDSVTELFASLKLSFPHVKGTPQRANKQGGSFRRLMTYLTLAALAAAIVALMRTSPDETPGPGTPDPGVSPPEGGLKISALVSRPAANHDCAAARRGQVPLRLISQALLPGSPTETAGAICGLAYAVETEENNVRLWIFTARSAPPEAPVTTKVRARYVSVRPKDPYEFTMPLPGKLEQRLVFEIAFVTSSDADSALAAKLESLADSLGGTVRPATWRGIIEELRASDAQVKHIVHEITP